MLQTTHITWIIMPIIRGIESKKRSAILNPNNKSFFKTKNGERFQ